MEGLVLKVPGSEPGEVRADSGSRYTFVLSDWTSQVRPVRGDRVSFMGNNGQATRIKCLKAAKDSDGVLRVAAAPSVESRFRRGPVHASAAPVAQTGPVSSVTGRLDTNPAAVVGTAQKTSPLAIISLIAGLAGLIFFGSLIAVICGHIARANIRDSDGALGGEGLALAGLLLGYLGLLITLGFMALVGVEVFAG